MADPLDATARSATLCAYCPKMCRFACPVSEAEARETVTTWGKMSLVYLARSGDASLDDEGAQQALEACTGCGACVEQCAHGNPVAETLFIARGIAGTERSRRFRERFEATGDVKGRDLHTPLQRLRRDKKAKVAYFPGCTRLCSDPKKIDRDLEALRVAMGEDVATCDLDEGMACCGYPLYADGQMELLGAHLQKLGQQLAGHDVVVTPDPGCAYTLSVVRSALLREGAAAPARLGDRPAKRPEVLPLVEVLAARASRFHGRSAGLKVRYHDPCYLGRRGRTFSAPRKLLEEATLGVPLEFAQNREQADCSGGGGLYPVSNPEGARRIAERRLTEDGNAHIPVDVVVTACPSAERNFRRTGARVLDVVDVALGRIEDE